MAEKYTKYIDREECIGDSLVTINTNFANLDTATYTISSTHTWFSKNSDDITFQVAWYNAFKTQLVFATTWLVNNSEKQKATLEWVDKNGIDLIETTTYFKKISNDLRKNVAWYNLNGNLLTETYKVRAFEQTSKKSINVVSQANDIGKNNLEILYSDYSSILGGFSNYLKGDYNSLGGGHTNSIEGSANFIGAGVTNRIEGNTSVLLGGNLNIIQGNNNFVGGGMTSEVKGDYNSMCGGLMNKITANYAGILGGTNNHVRHNNSFIIGSNITTTAPNNTYVNYLNLVNTPNIDNNTNMLLVRSSNGNVGVKIINGIESVDDIYTWTKGNSAAILRYSLWIEANSSSFVNNNFVLDVSSSLYNQITSNVNQIITAKHTAWLSTNFNTVTSTINSFSSIYNKLTSTIEWFEANKNELDINLQQTRDRKKYTEIIEVQSSNFVKNIAHKLETKDVMVVVYNNITGENVISDVKRYDSNNLTITLINADFGLYKVVVMS
jgi:hypothetical protein